MPNKNHGRKSNVNVLDFLMASITTRQTDRYNVFIYYNWFSFAKVRIFNEERSRFNKKEKLEKMPLALDLSFG